MLNLCYFFGQKYFLELSNYVLTRHNSLFENYAYLEYNVPTRKTNLPRQFWQQPVYGICLFPVWIYIILYEFLFSNKLKMSLHKFPFILTVLHTDQHFCALFKWWNIITELNTEYFTHFFVKFSLCNFWKCGSLYVS